MRRNKSLTWTVSRMIVGVIACTILAPPLASAHTGSRPAPENPRHTQFGNFGIDVSARDLSVDPGDDFQRYASGRWLSTHPIPPDQPMNGVGLDAHLLNQERLKEIVTGASKDSQLGAFYASYMDQAHRDLLDSKPLEPDLQRVASIRTKAEFARNMGATNGGIGETLFALQVMPDPSNPAINSLYVSQSGMGLPDRDYYLSEKYARQLQSYRAYIERTMRLIGHEDASAEADRIIAFETALAKVAWPQTDLRDFSKLDNPMSPAELQAYAPGFDWNAYLDASRAHVGKLIVADNTAVKATAALFDATPLETLKAWQQFKIADEMSNMLSTRFIENKFQFAKDLTGVTKQRPQWQRAMDQVDARFGELVGKEYVQRYFSPSSKAMMEGLVANLKTAAGKRILGNSWMSAETKQAALAKLSKMQVMVGYPDKFRDYSGLELKADDLYGNVRRSNAFEWEYRLSQAEKPVDHKKWDMSPATVDAYDGFLENKIVFPAGILQPPFFDPAADPAVNYGAIGAVIGHEIMHGFDDQGRKFDANGKLHDWWTADDAKRFTEITSRLADQYSSYEAAPGVFINGKLTMGENIGDMSGLQVAYDAYRISLHGKKAPILDGLTGDQRFFLAFAQVWRGMERPDIIKMQVASNPHSPRRFRVIGTLRNIDAWYSAFNIRPGSKFYLPPDQRVRLW